LLQAILYDLGLPYEGRGEQELRLALTDFLLHNYTAGKRTVLIMDEAQHLTPDLLEELRLLANLEARHGRAFQVILAAQPALLHLLRLPELEAVSQRLAVRARLEPLPIQEAADYLLHQLRLAGGRPEAIVSDEALDVLARGTGGVPRLLNQAAHQAFLLAHTHKAAQVDAEAALEALDLLGLAVEEPASAPGTLSLVGSDEAGEDEFDRALGPMLALEDADDARLSLGGEGEDGSPKRRLFSSPRRPA
jgi:type II secretory pathway predicted ATPase ExeA